MAHVVYDKDGKEFKVAHRIDVKEWLEAGYLEENPKDNKPEYDRDALKVEADELEIEYAANIGSGKLFKLIEARKLELES